jgi:hypothetical protein
MKKQKITAGCRARLGKGFYLLFGETEWEITGVTVIAPHEPIAGCWKVRFDGVEPLQYVHERFMEVIK